MHAVDNLAVVRFKRTQFTHDRFSWLSLKCFPKIHAYLLHTCTARHQSKRWYRNIELSFTKIVKVLVFESKGK